MIYRNFALVYDELMNHAPYDKWTAFTLEIIEKFKKDIDTIIDLGCGTGEITLQLAEHGCNMYGIDSSNEMLAIAMEKSLKKQLPVQWFQQDIRQLAGFNEIDMAISYCDVFNYIATEQDLLTSFKNVFDSLRDGGLFLFDVHGKYYVRHHLVNHSFTSRDPEISYIWDCEQGAKQEEIIHYLNFFVQTENGLYERFDEVHKQYVFPLETYENLLKKAEFTILNIYEDFSSKTQLSTKKAERVFVLAEKRVT